jgi:hypothetical protein
MIQTIQAHESPSKPGRFIRPVAVKDLPTKAETDQLVVDGVRWQVELMDPESKTYRVPSSVYIRAKEAEAAGINLRLVPLG